MSMHVHVFFLSVSDVAKTGLGAMVSVDATHFACTHLSALHSFLPCRRFQNPISNLPL